MKTKGKTILNPIFAIFLVMIILFGSCKKKEDNKPAPAIPPQSSFVIDFSDFSNPDDTLGSREVNTYHNWGYSYFCANVWNAIITVGLAVPVASFVESFNHEAVYHPDQNNWTWSYNFMVNSVAYEAELTGYIESDSVVWEMRITKGSQYSNFLWYHGKSAVGGAGGYWILKENPANPNDLLEIDWNHNADGTADIRYTNIRPSDPENGGFIKYGSSTADMDRFYMIYNKGMDNMTVINWSSTQKNGNVSDPNHFGDNDMHCWDTNLMDTICP